MFTKKPVRDILNELQNIESFLKTPDEAKTIQKIVMPTTDDRVLQCIAKLEWIEHVLLKILSKLNIDIQ